MKFDDYAFIQVLVQLIESLAEGEAVTIGSTDEKRSKGDIKNIVKTAIYLTGKPREYTLSWAGDDQRALVIALKQ